MQLQELPRQISKCNRFTPPWGKHNRHIVTVARTVKNFTNKGMLLAVRFPQCHLAPLTRPLNAMGPPVHIALDAVGLTDAFWRLSV